MKAEEVTQFIENYPIYLFSGGYYSDAAGFVSTGCRKCPNGSFVAFHKAPGTQVQDCKTCPLGKPLFLNILNLGVI